MAILVLEVFCCFQSMQQGFFSHFLFGKCLFDLEGGGQEDGWGGVHHQGWQPACWGDFCWQGYVGFT